LPAAAQNRPKVGLVLSGGGAKGIAHIGVLKALEEAGITPDYITGTSMGSIVGGLYAAGYKADELRAIVERMDWDVMLSNKVPFNEVVYEEKYYANRYLLDFYYANRKLIFPKGIIEGENLIRLFSQLTRPVHGLDFDQLPIPFACIATDIVKGQAVVLRRGSLAMAMRASMSIPSIFTPVRIDDKLLVDGGLIQNMPVNEIKKMGADIVIAVNVSIGLEPEAELSSPISIITQSAFIAAAHEAEAQGKLADILIKPNVAGISTGSFNLSSIILARGDDAGKEYLDRFKRLADSLNRLGPARSAVVIPKAPDAYEFREVMVSGVDDPDQERFILGKLNVTPNTTVTINELEHRMATLYATRYYQRIWYEVLGTPDSRILKVHAVANPQTQFKFSYHYDSENKGGIVLNATFRNKLLPRSRLVLEADLASFPRVTLDYLKYLGARQNFAAQITGVYNNTELPVLTNRGGQEGSFSSRYFGAIARLQTARFLNSALGVEALYSHMMLKPKIGGDDIRDINWIKYNYATFGIYHRFDNTNDRYFPSRGLRSEIILTATPKVSGSLLLLDTIQQDARWLGPLFYSDNIYAGAATIEPFIPVSPRFTILAKARYRKSNMPEGTLNLGNYDYVGGFLPNLPNSHEYYGAAVKEYLVASYLYGRVGLQYRALSKLYLAAHYNVLYAHDDLEGILSGKNFRQGFAVSAGYATPIGPLKFFLAKDPDRDAWQASLAIGFYY